MASLPLQFGDVVRALEICLWIREKCFEPSNRADQRYKAFLNEVLRLESALKDLKAAIAYAFREIEDVEPYISGERELVFDDQNTITVPGAGEIIGDFGSTLKDCEQLLQQHVRFQNDRATAISSAFWHIQVQAQVDDLRKRLQSHIGSTSLVVAVANLRLLGSLKEEIRRLTDSSSGRGNPLALPPVMVLLARRFEDAIFKDPPSPFANIQGVPVQDTIKIMCYHLRRAIKKTSEDMTPSTQQRLGLIKAHWLLTVLKSSQNFPSCPRRYQRIVEGIEGKIELIYSTQTDVAVIDSQLATMPDEMFQIWPQKYIPPIVLPIQPSEHEEAVGSAPLIPTPHYERQNLHMIRLSSHRLRLTSEDFPHRPHPTAKVVYSSSPFNAWHDGLIPTYAITPFTADKTYSLQITSSKDEQAVTYEVQNIRDAATLQNACVGHSVWGYEIDVTFTAALSARFRPVLRKGFGVIQLLEHPVSAQHREALMEPQNGSQLVNGDPGSASSIASRSNVSSVFRSFSPSILSQQQDEGMEVYTVRKPPPPFLVSFVKENPDKKVKTDFYTMYKVDSKCPSKGMPACADYCSLAS